jgi:hypothetical protein
MRGQCGAKSTTLSQHRAAHQGLPSQPDLAESSAARPLRMAAPSQRAAHSAMTRASVRTLTAPTDLPPLRLPLACLISSSASAVPRDPASLLPLRWLPGSAEFLYSAMKRLPADSAAINSGRRGIYGRRGLVDALSASTAPVSTPSAAPIDDSPGSTSCGLGSA